MPYAITDSGWRAVGEDVSASDLMVGEALVAQVPQSLIDSIKAAEETRQLALVEEVWRSSEMEFIGYQLTAIEDDDPSALPGTVAQWREYRIKVRAWVEGTDGYPHAELRPARPV